MECKYLGCRTVGKTHLHIHHVDELGTHEAVRLTAGGREKEGKLTEESAMIGLAKGWRYLFLVDERSNPISYSYSLS